MKFKEVDYNELVKYPLFTDFESGMINCSSLNNFSKIWRSVFFITIISRQYTIMILSDISYLFP